MEDQLQHSKVRPFSGDRLRGWRLAKGMTLEDLARRLPERGGRAVTRHTIRNWEEGRSEPRATDVLALASIFDCATNDLHAVDE